jgi:DNA repair protein RadA
LGGGLETQTITEIYGEYGSGKSQLCHQMCVNVQLPIEHGGLNGSALYIDTENTFRTERIVQMAKHLGLTPEEVVKNIVFAEAYTSDHQMFLLENADKIIKENNIRLIVVDSLTAHFRSEYLGREMLAERQQKLNKHMHRLIRLARAFNAVAVVTNQVMAKPDVFFGDAVHPVGGHIVAHTSHTRIYLRKSPRGPTRIARLVSSPYLPEGERVFKVTENGVEDVNKEDQQGRR